MSLLRKDRKITTTVTFDPTKPVETRDGRKARIIATDRNGVTPIVALVMNGNYEDAYYYYDDGSTYGRKHQDYCADLVNVPERRKEYRNVWKESGARSQSYKTIKEAVHSVKNNSNMLNKYTGWILELSFEDEVLVTITPIKVNINEEA